MVAMATGTILPIGMPRAAVNQAENFNSLSGIASVHWKGWMLIQWTSTMIKARLGCFISYPRMPNGGCSSGIVFSDCFSTVLRYHLNLRENVMQLLPSGSKQR